jgi:quercetin dioxygenase-like cupin family protein
MHNPIKSVDVMKPALLAAAVASLCMAAASVPAQAQNAPSGAVLLTPDKMAWKPNPRNPSQEVSDLVGDATKAGPYVQRVKYPPNNKVPPHTHPEDRSYTIVSGTWYIAWGETCDEAKMIALPAGSYYTEPANVAHCVASRGEPVVLEIRGIGPSGIKRLEAAK